MNDIAVVLNCLFVSFLNFVCNILNYLTISFVLPKLEFTNSITSNSGKTIDTTKFSISFSKSAPQKTS